MIVRRGDVVEATHRRARRRRPRRGGRRAGRRRAAGGLPALSAKPFQALPLVRARDDLTTEEIAIASASHLASPEQLAAVRSLLAKAPAERGRARVRRRSRPRCEHNCSGKHAGMLALCRAHGWAERRLPARDAPGPARAASPRSRPPRTCPRTRSRPPSTAAASSRSRSRSSGWRCSSRGSSSVEGGARVAAAMRAHPELIRGPVAADTLLMRELEGWTAKGGAEGLICAVGPDGLGIALKVEDGSMRALRPGARRVPPQARPRDRRARSRAARELARRARRRGRRGAVNDWSNLATTEPRSVVGSGPRWSEPAPPIRLFCVSGRFVSPSSREESRGPCSPSISLCQTSRSSRSSSSTARRKASSPTTRSSPGLEEVELTKEQIEDFYTYLIDHSIELVEGEQYKPPPHEQPALAEDEKPRRSSTSPSSPRSTRCGSTSARSARCRC